MMNDTIEYEDVQIGNWQNKIPSQICTNKEVFNQIFSLETWNEVMSSEQRERIMDLMPKEIKEHGDLAHQTMEDLLTRKLTRFDENPLEKLFESLEQGHFDPEVVQTKLSIQNEIKKECLRKRKKYHTKLLEEIVVSREIHLKRAKLTSKNNNKTEYDYDSASSLSSPFKLNKLNIKNNNNNNNQKTAAFIQKVENRFKDEMSIISRSAGYLSSTDDEMSISVEVSNNKKQTKTKKATTTATKRKSNPPAKTKGKTIVRMNSDNLAETMNCVVNNITSSPSPEKVEDELLLGNSSIMPNRSNILPPLKPNQKYLPANKSKPTTNKTMNQVQNQITTINMDNPILASHLSSGMNSSTNLTNLSHQNQIMNKQMIPKRMKSSSNHNINLTMLHDNIIISSSEDEFESIEPTIGLLKSSTSANSPISGISPSSTSSFIKTNINQNSNNPKLLLSATSLHESSKVLPNLKESYNQQRKLNNNLMISGNASIANTSNSNSSLTQHLLTFSNNQKINTNNSIFKLSPTSLSGESPFIGGLITTDSTMSNLQNQQQNIIQNFQQISSNNANKSSTSSILNIQNNNLSNNGPILTNLQMNRSSSSTSTSTLPFLGHKEQNILIDNSSNFSGLNSLSNHLSHHHDDLNLNLNLSGLDEIHDMDKIDDLSVLDGNPFDSIPNLSDELDGLDLDLVDGLCDFEGLSEEKQFSCFFSLIREIICSTPNHRMTLLCIEKGIRKWSISPSALLNIWFLEKPDWNSVIGMALNFLAGNYQDVHPEDFVPYIEYKFKSKYYQWIGAGRDSDNNLTPLCHLWLENLDRLPPIKKVEGDHDDDNEEEDENEDSDALEETKKKAKVIAPPPPPRCLTDWTVRPSTEQEKSSFQEQESVRFENPHKAFTYKMHGYESVVGPVKGVYSSQSGITNKARGHSLLVDDRPPYVTILALVRDAVARLPNGEGTRSEICEILRDSAFLALEASNVTLNSVVSGALDRLHYERDPCVRYDSHKKSWIYLHRDRTQEQFERLHHNRSYTKSTKSRSNTSRNKSRKTPANKTVSPSGSTSTNSMNSDNFNPTTPNATSTPNSNKKGGKGGKIFTTISTATVSSSQSPVISTPPTTIGTTNVNVNVSNNKITTPTTTAFSFDIKPAIKDPKSTTTTTNNQIQQQQQQQHQPIPLEAIKKENSIIKSALTSTSTTTNSSEIISSFNNSNNNSGNPTISVVNSNPSVQKVRLYNSPTTSMSTSVATENKQNLIGNIMTTGHQPILTTSQLQQPVQSSNNNNISISNAILTNTSTITNNSISSGGNVSGIASISQNNTPTISTHFAPGQLVLGSSALLRLASSLRIPENVRFAQIRLPTQANNNQTGANNISVVGNNTLRLPQHRIILRGPMPNTQQGQGILLGQTSSGQTVILSSGTNFGNLQNAGSTTQITPISISGNSLQDGQTNQSFSISSPISIANLIAQSQRSGVSGDVISTLLNQNTLSRTTGIQSSTPILTTSSSNTTPQSQLQQVQNKNIITQLQNTQQQHQQQSTGQQISSPIIIRSSQGDFMIPGHLLGGGARGLQVQGMQGIKVIPMTSSKQTILTRLVSPQNQNIITTSTVATSATSATNTIISPDMKTVISKNNQNLS